MGTTYNNDNLVSESLDGFKFTDFRLPKKGEFYFEPCDGSVRQAPRDFVVVQVDIVEPVFAPGETPDSEGAGEGADAQFVDAAEVTENDLELVRLTVGVDIEILGQPVTFDAALELRDVLNSLPLDELAAA